MKIRTDFVTNSSSSSFVLEICIELENGKSLLFNANGGTAESGIIDYFWSDATVTVSPKQLGNAKSVQELIELLKNGVYDGWVSQGDKLFENNSTAGYKRKQNPTYFIAMIQEYVHSMDDISRIVIKGNESGGLFVFSDPHYHRTFAYSPKTGDYVCTIDGCEFEKDGSSGGDLVFSDESEAREVKSIYYGYDVITTQGYAIQKGKEKKQKLRDAIKSGSVEVVLGEAGTASKLSKQYAREVSAAPESIAFEGKIFVHTSCSNEETIDKFIMSKGGDVRSSTVQTTDYLIIGNDIDHKTTKISRALELNAKGKAIIAMTESEFWTLAATLNIGNASAEPNKNVTLRVAILGEYPNFTKKQFERYVTEKGMIYKSSVSHQLDYVVVDTQQQYDWVNRRKENEQPIFLKEFVELLDITFATFEKEMSDMIKKMQEEELQKETLAVYEKEILGGEIIHEKAYAADQTIKTLRIGGNVKIIGKEAFADCKYLSTLIIEDGIEEIGEKAFKNCVSIEKIEIPSSVKTIKKEAFKGCKKLSQITLNEGIEYIESLAFNTSRKISELIIPKSIKHNISLPPKIKSLIYKEGVENIGLPRDELEYLKIPSTAQKVECYNWYGYSKMLTIEYAGKLSNLFDIVAKILGGKKGFKVICTDGELDCMGGKHLTIPEGVEKIPEMFGFAPIESITLPSTLREISRSAFSHSELKEIVIPNGVTKLDAFTFAFTPLKKASIPSGMQIISAYTFSGCEELSEIYYAGTKEKWNKIIEKSPYNEWDESLPPYTIFCSDGTIKGKQ